MGNARFLNVEPKPHRRGRMLLREIVLGVLISSFVYGYFLYMYVVHVYAWCPHRSEEGCRDPETGDNRKL